MATLEQTTEADVPPKLDKDSPTGRINVIASEALLQRIEEWRATQRPIPNKSEAARMLIERALDADPGLGDDDKAAEDRSPRR